MSNPTWSSDGQFIAFECEESAEATYICIMNVDGSDIVQLAEGYEPAWQPVP
jgi:hypothetical protein